MDPLFTTAAALWSAVDTAGDLRLVGGLAVRLTVGELSRATADIDVVSLQPATTTTLLAKLREAGYAVGLSGGWWRALKLAPSRQIIDVSPHPVVNPRTFESMTLRGEPTLVRVGAVTIAVAAANDLALLKLSAGRDQDLVDLLVLARGGRLSAQAVARAAEQDDVERTLVRTANLARHSLRSGELGELAEEVLGRTPAASELEALSEFLEDLRKEGL